MSKSSVDQAFDRCNDKYTIDLDKVQDGQLLLASDSLSDIRIEFNDLNKLYFEFVEKCPTSFPDRRQQLTPAIHLYLVGYQNDLDGYIVL